MNKTTKLAIVIPAYKASYLNETLQSIASQSCKNFNLYIGDDNSPYDLFTIVKPWLGKLNINFKKFDQNIGGRNLVDHWERCISMSNEEWIWLFSDDDLMDANCVAKFYETLDKKPLCDVFHFDTIEINNDSKVIKHNPNFPEIISSLDFAKLRMTDGISSYAPDYIFSRRAYIDNSGFQSFPLAWCSDDATWIKLSRRYGIHTIVGSYVYWRRSGVNITSLKGSSVEDKFRAAIYFTEWFKKNYITNENFSQWEKICTEWLFRQLINLFGGIKIRKWIAAIYHSPYSKLYWIKLTYWHLKKQKQKFN